MTIYIDERNQIVKLTQSQYDLLPESKQKRLKVYEEPKLPEFLENKKESNATSNSVQPQDKGNLPNGEGSSGTSGIKEAGENSGNSGTGVLNQQKEPAKRGRKPGAKVTAKNK